MTQVKRSLDESEAALLRYSDTGESGETYDIDVQSVRWLKMHRPGILGDLVRRILSRECADSESGEAHEAEAEVSHCTRISSQ